MKILDYTIRDQTDNKSKPIENTQAEKSRETRTEYVTHKELSALEDKITHKIDEIVKENEGV